MATADIRMAEATELGHALVAHVAAGLGIRALSIKGPVPAAHGIRPPFDSQDVDVMVDPARFDELLAAMASLGWNEPYEVDSPAAMSSHSVTVIHPNWACAIDLHRQYPGIFAEPAVAFELMWQRHVTLKLASRDAPAADILASLCLSALHSLRDPDFGRSLRELEQAVAATKRLDPAQQTQLIELATGLRSLTSMSPLFIRAGLPPQPDDLSPLEHQLWELRTNTAPKTLPWLLEFRGAPVRRWPGIAKRALFPPEAYFRQAHPDVAPGGVALFGARMRRIGRGLAALPQAVGSLRRSE